MLFNADIIMSVTCTEVGCSSCWTTVLWLSLISGSLTHYKLRSVLWASRWSQVGCEVHWLSYCVISPAAAVAHCPACYCLCPRTPFPVSVQPTWLKPRAHGLHVTARQWAAISGNIETKTFLKGRRSSPIATMSAMWCCKSPRKSGSRGMCERQLRQIILNAIWTPQTIYSLRHLPV